nr:hypothetical protein GCM10020093_099890 [Planobispora longispora]
MREAKNALIKMIRDESGAEAARALDNYEREPPEWREASLFARSVLLIDAAEMKELVKRIDDLLAPYALNHRDRSEAPPGARIAEAHITLFPRAERRPHGLPSGS